MCHQSLQMLHHRVKPIPITNVIVEDESWIFTWDPESKHACSVWTHPGYPRPQKPRIKQATVKLMLVVFFNMQGVIHKEFVPSGVGIRG